MSSWLPESADGVTEFDGVFGLRPELRTGQRDFLARLWRPGVMDPVLLELVRLRVAGLHECHAELGVRTRPAVDAGLDEDVVARLPYGAGDAAFDERTSAYLLFAELFVLDPGQVTAEQRKQLTELAGQDGLVALAMACAMLDGFARFHLVLGTGGEADPGRPRLVDPPPFDPAAPAEPPAPDPADPIAASPLALQPDLLASFLRLYGDLWWRGVLDHPTKEVARLRNARVTGCRYCRNVRFAQAREDGLSEEVVALIGDDYAGSDLTERYKVVIRFADLFLGNPHGATDDAHADLRADLIAAFGPDGIVELAAGLALFMGFSKIAVSLGTIEHDFPTMVVPTPGR